MGVRCQVREGEKNFALIGAAGYIAPRHMQAIKETGNRLVVALDKSDSVGIMDGFFYDVDFFTEFERFDRHVEKLKRQGDAKRIHYVSICSPNYLHDAHIRFALRIGADAICEKPLVINPWNLDGLEAFEIETQRKIYAILQLRLHPAMAALREQVAAAPAGTIFDVELTYVTSRGRWYFASWKSDKPKSGGIATNIGIHFFDVLIWIFGNVQSVEVHASSESKMAGFLQLERAKVRWFLSVDKNDLPEAAVQKGDVTYRAMVVNGEAVEFSHGFTDLHTASYRRILEGYGFDIATCRPSIELAYTIRNSTLSASCLERRHPMLVVG